MKLNILNNGSCEAFKAGVHGCACALAGLMALYNGAAWLRRRQRHLAINALVYSAALVWERRHVLHHLVCRQPRASDRPQEPVTLARTA